MSTYFQRIFKNHWKHTRFKLLCCAIETCPSNIEFRGRGNVVPRGVQWTSGRVIGLWTVDIDHPQTAFPLRCFFYILYMLNRSKFLVTKWTSDQVTTILQWAYRRRQPRHPSIGIYVMGGYITNICCSGGPTIHHFNKASSIIQSPHTRNEIKRHSHIHFFSICTCIPISCLEMEWCRCWNHQFYDHYQNDNY